MLIIAVYGHVSSLLSRCACPLAPMTSACRVPIRATICEALTAPCGVSAAVPFDDHHSCLLLQSGVTAGRCRSLGKFSPLQWLGRLLGASAWPRWCASGVRRMRTGHSLSYPTLMPVGEAAALLGKSGGAGLPLWVAAFCKWSSVGKCV